jgi:hypothetical protein
LIQSNSNTPLARLFLSDGQIVYQGRGLLRVKNGSDGALGSSLLCPNERTSSGLTVGILFAYHVGGVAARDLDGRYADSPLHDLFNHLASGRGHCRCMVWSSKPLPIRIGTFVLIAWNLPSFCDFVHENANPSKAYSHAERVSEIDLMSAIYPLSVHRRIERQWAERINSLRQIHGQIVVGTERTLQRVFNNDGSLIRVPIRAVVDRRQLDQSQPHD